MQWRDGPENAEINQLRPVSQYYSYAPGSVFTIGNGHVFGNKKISQNLIIRIQNRSSVKI